MLQDWIPCCHSMLFSVKHPASCISGQYRCGGTFFFSLFVLFSIAIHVNGQFHIGGGADQSTHSRRGENNLTTVLKSIHITVPVEGRGKLPLLKIRIM